MDKKDRLRAEVKFMEHVAPLANEVLECRA